MIEVVAAALLVVVVVGLLANMPPAGRPWARRSLSALSVALLVTAVVMLGYPFYTNLYQSRVQQRLEVELASPELARAYRSGRVEQGDAVTRIRIPAIDVDVVVAEGTTSGTLRAGAGHYPATPLPCEPGNVAVAGHRTTYGQPFHDLDDLEPGDVITLVTPIGECDYVVADEPFVVTPTETEVLGATAEPTLTLTTCHPKGSASQRLIVQATLDGQTASTVRSTAMAPTLSSGSLRFPHFGD